MNKDQIEGSAKEIVGKVQRKTGEWLGNPVQQVKGLAKQIEGTVQKRSGDIKEILESPVIKP